MSHTDKTPFSVTATFALVLLNVLFWLGYGVIIAFDLHPALPDSPGIHVFMLVASLVNALVLMGLFYSLSRKVRRAYYLAVTFFILMSLLTMLDEVGWVDLLFLAANILPIVFLIRDRRWYLGGEGTQG